MNAPQILLTIVVCILLLFLSYMIYRIVYLPYQIKKKNQQEKYIQLNKELEPLGFLYDLHQDFFYSTYDCWQKEFGYCRFYDEACAPLSMIIDCEPIYFTYQNKKWLIEFWKGQYGMVTGAEVGIYNTHEPNPDPTEKILYQAVSKEEMLPITYTLRKNGTILYWQKATHWWLTGFKLGLFSKPDELTMDIQLTFPTISMRNAFINGLLEAGYKKNEIYTEWLTVYITFSSPKTTQPESRTELMEKLALKNNSFYCELYNFLTKKYSSTLDKIEFVKEISPTLYKMFQQIGKPKAVYRAFSKLAQEKSLEEETKNTTSTSVEEQEGDK